VFRKAVPLLSLPSSWILLTILPRDAMRKRDMSRRLLFVRLSVRPSHWRIVPERRSSNFFSAWYLSFLEKIRCYPLPRGRPVRGALNERGFRKTNSSFWWPMSHWLLQMVLDMPMVTMERFRQLKTFYF